MSLVYRGPGRNAKTLPLQRLYEDGNKIDQEWVEHLVKALIY